MFGVRALIILKKHIFPLGYNEIYKEAMKINLDNLSKTVIDHAIHVRSGGPIEEKLLYKNITFLNQVIYPEIKQELKTGIIKRG